MRTAIFVYQTTSLNIRTSEDDLMLCSMSNDTVSLSQGQNSRSIAPGIYKIISYNAVQVTGDSSAFDVVTPEDKTSDPTLPPRLASASFGPVDIAALNQFFTVPDAKDFARP
jgi:hypothetical protein